MYDEPERFDRVAREALATLVAIAERDYTKQDREPEHSRARRLLALLDLERDRYRFEIDYEHNLINRRIPFPRVTCSGPAGDVVELLRLDRRPDAVERLRQALIDVLGAAEFPQDDPAEALRQCGIAARRGLEVSSWEQAVDCYDP